MWFNLKIQEHICKYTPLKKLSPKIEYCDSVGNKLKYIPAKYEKGFYEDISGNRIDNAFLLIENKPFQKYEKTKEVTKSKLTDITEIEDLIRDKTYLLYCDSLLKELKDSNKAIKFHFSNGGKDYSIAYVFESRLYEGFLFMVLGKAKISDSIKPIIETMKEKKKAEQLNLIVQGVEKLNVNMIEL